MKKHTLKTNESFSSPNLVQFPAATSTEAETLRKFAEGVGACSVDCLVFSDVKAERLYSRGFKKGWKKEFAKHLLVHLELCLQLL